jgi:hypothetical protein
MMTIAPTSQIKLFIAFSFAATALLGSYRYWITWTTVRVCGSTITRCSLTMV